MCADEEGKVCAICGDAFGAQTDGDRSCDRCDKCGAHLHVGCILTHQGLRGEYALCATCLSAQRQSSILERIDFRQIPPTACKSIHSRFFPTSSNRRDGSKLKHPEGEAISSSDQSDLQQLDN